MRTLAASVLAFPALATSLLAQDPFPFPRPPAATVVRDTGVVYDRASGQKLDSYRPASATGALPTLVFFPAARSNSYWMQWAEFAASRGITSILVDVRQDSAGRDVDAILAHIKANARALHADTSAIATFGASGTSYVSLPVSEDPSRTAIKAAVVYYGAPPIRTFRADLPVLLARAGLDRAPLNTQFAALVSGAIAQNAPVTVINHAGGHHAFEMLDIDDVTRAVMEQTVDFVKRTTRASYRAALLEGAPEALAAAMVLKGDYAGAAAAYAPLVAKRPNDPPLHLAYGEALVGDKQYAAACAHLEKLKGTGLGPRDLGMPAARSCALSGNADAAIAWLLTIPARFMLPNTQQDSAFVSIANRDDFKAVFIRR